MKTISQPSDRNEARRIIEDLLGSEGSRELAEQVLEVLAERGCGWRMAATAVASLEEDELGAVIDEAADRLVDGPAAKKLAAQWPKRCGCGRVYARSGADHRMGQKAGLGDLFWDRLGLATSPRAPDGRHSDAFATSELRNCTCGSTLMALVEIHDLSEE